MAGSRFLEQAPILVAETTTIKNGIKDVLQVDYCRIQVEGDNKIIIKAMQA